MNALFGTPDIKEPKEKKPNPDDEERRLKEQRSRALLKQLNRGLSQLTFSGSNIRTGSN